MRNRLVRLAAAVAVAACLLAAGGCGGGDDTGTSAATTTAATTTASREHPKPTTGPAASGQYRPPGSTATTAAAPRTPRPGAEQLQRRLAPFVDCLRRHGVEPARFDGSGAGARQFSDPAQIRARIACIPELPPRMRRDAEKLKRRYEQRTG